MPWVKIDDQMPDHPKLKKAGPLAAWMWVCSLTYSARFLTDGFIPAEVVDDLVRLDDIRVDGKRVTARDLARKLCVAKLWRKVKGGYQINDFLEFQQSRDKVLKERAEVRERVKRYRQSKRESNGVTGALGNGDVTVPPAPAPAPGLGSVGLAGTAEGSSFESVGNDASHPAASNGNGDVSHEDEPPNIAAKRELARALTKLAEDKAMPP